MDNTGWEWPAERGATLRNVGNLWTLRSRMVVRRLGNLCIWNREAESIAEGEQLHFGELLRLMRRVRCFNGWAECPALHRLRQDHRWCPLMRNGGGVGGVDLSVVVSAAAELHKIVVAEVPHQLLEERLRPEEVLSDVGTTSDRVLLEFAVNGCIHLADEFAVVILRQKIVPLASPDDLDHVPASAAEEALQLLDDLSVAAHRTIKALQVAVHHPGEIVQAFARRKRECASRLWFIHLAVAKEGPDATIRCIRESAIVQIAVVARLINGSDPAETHGDGWELPEIWEEARMRI